MEIEMIIGGVNSMYEWSNGIKVKLVAERWQILLPIIKNFSLDDVIEAYKEYEYYEKENENEIQY